MLDDRQQRGQLFGGAVEVVGRQQPERDHLDAGLLTPFQQWRDVVGARLVSLGGVGAVGLSPSAVAIEHDTDVARQRLLAQGRSKSTLVGA